jgi:hypothetical protein
VSLVRADGTMSLAVRVKRGFDQVRLLIEADRVNLLKIPTSRAVHGDVIAHRSMTLPAFFSMAGNLMDSANV